MRDFHTPTTSTSLQGRYVGPDAWQIAGRLPHRVRFERGWFHTSAVLPWFARRPLVIPTAARRRSDRRALSHGWLPATADHQTA